MHTRKDKDSDQSVRACMVMYAMGKRPTAAKEQRTRTKGKKLYALFTLPDQDELYGLISEAFEVALAW